jgi:RimJ/RimL family protein N-acetyltransferase
MARHMAWADLAICAGGSTCLELACLGVPALLVVIAENQLAPAAALERRGIARIVARHVRFNTHAAARAIAELCRDAAARAEMSRRGRELVDGHGAQRVVRALRRPQVRLRPATAADCRRWWEWRNEPEVRRVSFHGGEIPFEAHCGWFRLALDDARRRLLIVENAEHDAVGFVRLDFAANKAEISLGLDSRRRGQGYGEAAIRRAAALAFDTRGVESVEALAKQDNVASRRVFEHADFRVVEQTVVNGQPALRLLYQPGEAPKETPCT